MEKTNIKDVIEIPSFSETYNSPLHVVVDRMRFELDDQVMKAVQNVGIDVDKEELVKALTYDRDQYKKGFNDGIDSSMSSIVQCWKCAYFDDEHKVCKWFGPAFGEFDFCSNGKRRSEG